MEGNERRSSNRLTHLLHVQLHGKIIPFDELYVEQKIGHGGCTQLCGMALQWPLKGSIANTSKSNQESLKMEKTVLAALSRPHIVRMFGAVIEAGNIGIVMEYMCRSLFHAIFIDETEFR